MFSRSKGYAQIVSPVPHRANLDNFQCAEVRAGLTEFDTTVCCHCNKIFHITPGCRPEDLGGFCRLCMLVTCPKCADGECTPFERRLDEMEKRDYVKRQYALAMSA